LASVADPGCLSEIPDPYFSPFHPSNNNKKEEKKKFSGGKNWLSFFVAIHFTELKIIYFFLPGTGTE
jgi:hypothetical protein